MERTLLAKGGNFLRPVICEVNVPGRTENSLLTVREIVRGNVTYGVTDEGRLRLPEILAAGRRFQRFLRTNSLELGRVAYGEVDDVSRAESIRSLLKASDPTITLLGDGEEADVYSVNGFVIKHNDGRIANIPWRKPNNTAWERVRRMEALRIADLHPDGGVPKQYAYAIINHPDGHQESFTVMEEVPGRRVSWLRRQVGDNSPEGQAIHKRFVAFITQVMKNGERKIKYDPRSSYNGRLFTDPMYEGNTLDDGRKYWLLDQ